MPDPGSSISDPSAIGIVLAIYNGGDFLEQQLESIATQDHQEWVLYARDDGSSDHSSTMLEACAKRDARFHLTSDSLGNLGAGNNFATLMKLDALASHPYIAFSDQDDVWQQDKLSVQMDAMRRLERKFPETPLLVYSDMSVVKASLEMIAPSFMEYQGIKHEEIYPLKVLLAQNFITGCTVMVNRKLLDIALPVPEEALMHDWWLALCAAVFGHIGYIDEPLVKYRQHGGNVVGAKHLSDLFNPISSKWRQGWLEGRNNLFKSMKQAEILAERIRIHDIGNKNLPLVEAYASLPCDSPMQRIRKVKKLKVHAQSNMRQALLLSRLLFTPKVDKHG